jgi:hypothetical protein
LLVVVSCHSERREPLALSEIKLALSIAEGPKGKNLAILDKRPFAEFTLERSEGLRGDIEDFD